MDADNTVQATPSEEQLSEPDFFQKFLSGAAQGSGIPSAIRGAEATANGIGDIPKPYSHVSSQQEISDLLGMAPIMFGPGGMAIGAGVGGVMHATGLDKAIQGGIETGNQALGKIHPGLEDAAKWAETLAPIPLAAMGGKVPSAATKLEGIVGKDVAAAGPQELTQDLLTGVKSTTSKANAEAGGVKQWAKENPEAVNAVKDGQTAKPMNVQLKEKLQELLDEKTNPDIDAYTASEKKTIQDWIDEAGKAPDNWNKIDMMRRRFGKEELENYGSKGINRDVAGIYGAFRDVLDKNLPPEQASALGAANATITKGIKAQDQFKVSPYGTAKEKVDLSSDPNFTQELKGLSPEGVKNKLLGEIHENAFNPATGSFDKIKLGKFLDKADRNGALTDALGDDVVKQITDLSNKNPNRLEKFLNDMGMDNLDTPFKGVNKTKAAVENLIMPGYKMGAAVPATAAAERETLNQDPEKSLKIFHNLKTYEDFMKGGQADAI